MSAPIQVWKDGEIDETGVTPVWRWLCLSTECESLTAYSGSAIYWENALKGGLRHIKWHQDQFTPGWWS